MPELMKLLRTKSMMRYLPPNGTAGLARSLGKGENRGPLPPAGTIPSTRSRIGQQAIVLGIEVGDGLGPTPPRQRSQWSELLFYVEEDAVGTLHATNIDLQLQIAIRQIGGQTHVDLIQSHGSRAER